METRAAGTKTGAAGLRSGGQLPNVAVETRGGEQGPSTNLQSVGPRQPSPPHSPNLECLMPSAAQRDPLLNCAAAEQVEPEDEPELQPEAARTEPWSAQDSTGTAAAAPPLRKLNSGSTGATPRREEERGLRLEADANLAQLDVASWPHRMLMGSNLISCAAHGDAQAHATIDSLLRVNV